MKYEEVIKKIHSIPSGQFCFHAKNGANIILKKH